MTTPTIDHVETRCAHCGKHLDRHDPQRVELVKMDPVPQTRYWHDDCWRQHSNPGSIDDTNRRPTTLPDGIRTYRHRTPAYAMQILHPDDEATAVRWLRTIGYQWDDHLHGDTTGNREKKGFYYDYLGRGEPLTIRTPDGHPCQVHIGDWLVTHPDGTVQAYSDPAFHRLYEEAQ
jgi:hypothetical protein